MAGYPGTPLPRKLGIREGMRVAVLHAPPEFPAALGELPHGARLVSGRARRADLGMAFVTERRDIERAFAALSRAVAAGAGIWLAWPRKASGVPTSVTEDALREHILPAGWVDVKVCAIDGTWSGLRFARRAGRPAPTIP